MRRARLGAIVLGAVTIALLVSLPGTSRADEQWQLHNQINKPFVFRLLMSYAPDRLATEQRYGKPDIVRADGEHPYEIRAMQDGSRLVTLYRSHLGQVTDEWRLRRLPARGEFEALVPGITAAEQVKLIDPYFAILSGSDPDKGISEHRLRDRGLAKVEYILAEGRWIVDSVTIEDLDPSGFVSKLAPEDLAAFMDE